MITESEISLVAGLRQGDAECYRHVVESTIVRLLPVARRYLNEDECHDAVQSTYIKLLSSIDSFRGDSSIVTWLQRILINECLGRLRKQKQLNETSLDDLLPKFFDDGHRVNPLPAWPNSVRDAMHREECCNLITDNLKKLPTDYREVIMLRDIEGFNSQQAADMLAISVGAVKVRLHRARQALRELLEPVVLEELNDL